MSDVKDVEEGAGASYLLQNQVGRWRIRIESTNSQDSKTDEDIRTKFWEVPEAVLEAFIGHENYLPSGLHGAE